MEKSPEPWKITGCFLSSICLSGELESQRQVKYILGLEENILEAIARARREEEELRRKQVSKKGRWAGMAEWKWQRNLPEAEWRIGCIWNTTVCAVVGAPGNNQMPPLVMDKEQQVQSIKKDVWGLFGISLLL